MQTKRQRTGMAAQLAEPPVPIAKRERANSRPGNKVAPWIAVGGSKLALVIARQEARTIWARGEQVAEETA